MKQKTLVKINNRIFGVLDFPFDFLKHHADRDLGRKKITQEIIKLIKKNPKLRKRLAGMEIETAKFSAIPKRKLELFCKKAS